MRKRALLNFQFNCRYWLHARYNWRPKVMPLGIKFSLKWLNRLDYIGQRYIDKLISSFGSFWQMGVRTSISELIYFPSTNLYGSCFYRIYHSSRLPTQQGETVQLVDENRKHDYFGSKPSTFFSAVGTWENYVMLYSVHSCNVCTAVK